MKLNFNEILYLNLTTFHGSIININEFDINQIFYLYPTTKKTFYNGRQYIILPCDYNMNIDTILKYNIYLNS